MTSSRPGYWAREAGSSSHAYTCRSTTALHHAYILELYDRSPIGCPGAGAVAVCGILIGHAPRLVPVVCLFPLHWLATRRGRRRRLSFRRVCIGPRAVSRGRLVCAHCPLRRACSVCGEYSQFRQFRRVTGRAREGAATVAPLFLRLADHLVAFWATPGPQPQADLPPKPFFISLGLSFGPTLFSIFHLPHGPQRRCVPHASPTQPAGYTN